MIELFKSLRRGDDSDPMQVLEALTSKLPQEARTPTVELLQLFREAHTYGPPDPPEWLLALLESVGREVGLSRWLLCAVSWHLVSYHPGARATEGPHGVLGVPVGLLERPERYGAAPDDLHEGQDLEVLHEAVARVKRGAWTGARILKLYVERTGSLSRGLGRYMGEAGYPAGPSDVFGTLVVLLARQAPGVSDLELLEEEVGV